MNSSNVPFGDGPEQKQRWSTFWTTGLCSTKSCPRHDTFLSHIPWCRKAFTVSKKTNAVFFLFFFFNIQRLKVKKVSSGNHRHIVIRACSLLMLLLRSGGAITNLLLMLRPCFTWLLSSQPPHPPTATTTIKRSSWRRAMAADIKLLLWVARLTVTTTTCGLETTWLAELPVTVEVLQSADVFYLLNSFFCFFYFAASVDKSVLDLWWAAGSHHHYLRVHLFQASRKGINDSL